MVRVLAVAFTIQCRVSSELRLDRFLDQRAIAKIAIRNLSFFPSHVIYGIQCGPLPLLSYHYHIIITLSLDSCLRDASPAHAHRDFVQWLAVRSFLSTPSFNVFGCIGDCFKPCITCASGRLHENQLLLECESRRTPRFYRRHLSSMIDMHMAWRWTSGSGHSFCQRAK